MSFYQNGGAPEGYWNLYTELTEKESTKESLQVVAVELDEFRKLVADKLTRGAANEVYKILRSGDMLIMNISLLNLILSKPQGRNLSEKEGTLVDEFPRNGEKYDLQPDPANPLSRNALKEHRLDVFKGNRGHGTMPTNIYDPAELVNWLLYDPPPSLGMGPWLADLHPWVDQLFTIAQMLTEAITHRSTVPRGHLDLRHWAHGMKILCDLRRFVLLKNLIHEAEGADADAKGEFLLTKFRQMIIPPRLPTDPPYTMEEAGNNLYKDSFHGQVRLLVNDWIYKRTHLVVSTPGGDLTAIQYFDGSFDSWTAVTVTAPIYIIPRATLWGYFRAAATAGANPEGIAAVQELLNEDDATWVTTASTITSHTPPITEDGKTTIIDRMFAHYKCENNQHKVLFLYLLSIGGYVRRMRGLELRGCTIEAFVLATNPQQPRLDFVPLDGMALSLNQIKLIGPMFEHLKRELDARLEIANALWENAKSGDISHIKNCLGNLSPSYGGSPTADTKGSAATVTDLVTGDSENEPGGDPEALVEAVMTFEYPEDLEKYKDEFISRLKDQYRESFKAEITIVGEVSVTKGSTIFSATIRLQANQLSSVDRMVWTRIHITDESGKIHGPPTVKIVNRTPVANPSAPDANQSPQDGEPLSLLTDKMREMSRTLKSEIPDIGPVVEAAEDLKNDVISVPDTIVNRSTIAQSIATKLQNAPTENVYDTSNMLVRTGHREARTLNISIYNSDPDKLTALPSLEHGAELTPEIIKELTKLTNAIFQGVLGKDPKQIAGLFSLGDVRTGKEETQIQDGIAYMYTIKYLVKRQSKFTLSSPAALVESLEGEISAQHGSFVHLEGFGEGYQLGIFKKGDGVKDFEGVHSRVAKTKFMIPRSGDYKVAIGPTGTILHIFDGSPLKNATAVLDLHMERMTEITKDFKISQDTYIRGTIDPNLNPTWFRIHLAQGIVESCKAWIEEVVPRAADAGWGGLLNWAGIDTKSKMRKIMTRFSPCQCKMELDLTKLDFSTTHSTINLKIVPSGSNPHLQVKIELKDNFGTADNFCDFLNDNDKMKEFKIGAALVTETLIVIGTIDIFLAESFGRISEGLKGRDVGPRVPRLGGAPVEMNEHPDGRCNMLNAMEYLNLGENRQYKFDTPQYSYLTVEDIDSSPFIERIREHRNYGEFLLNWCGYVDLVEEKCGKDRFTRVHGGDHPEIVFHVPASANEAVGGAAPESDININLDDDEKEVFTDLYKSLNYDLISSYCVRHEKPCSEHRIAKNNLRNDIKKIIKEEIDETPPSASGTGTGTGTGTPSNQAELDRFKKEIEEANRKANEAKSAEQKRMFEQQSRLLKQQMDAMKSMAAKGTTGTTPKPGVATRPVAAGVTASAKPLAAAPASSIKPGEKKPSTVPVVPGPTQPISDIPGNPADAFTAAKDEDEDDDEEPKDEDKEKYISRRKITDDDNKKDTEEENQKNIIVDLFKKSPDGTIKMTDQELEDLLIDQIKITHKYDLLKQETFKLLDQNPDKLEQENKENKEKIKYLESKVFEILIQFINNQKSQKSQKSKGVNLRNLNSKLLQYIKELKGDDSDISLMNTEKYIEILESLDSEILTVQPTTALKTKSKSRKQLGKKSMKQRVNNRKKKKKTLSKDKKKTKGKSKKTPIKEKKISILKPKRTPTKKRIGSPNKAIKSKISPKNLQLIKTPQKQSNILAYKSAQPIKASNTKFINRY